MTMAAGPVSLEHHTRRTSSYDEPIIDVNAETEEGVRLNGDDESPSEEENTNDRDGEDSDDDTEADGEEDDEDDLGTDVSKTTARRRVSEKAEDIVMEDEDEDEESSSAAEEGEESEESDSDSESENVAGSDAVSEAAETAASAEVQTRNNCV